MGPNPGATMARRSSLVPPRSAPAALALGLLTTSLSASLAAQEPAADPAAQDPKPDAPGEAQEPAAEDGEREWIGGMPWWRWSRATGDLADQRRWLEEQGIELGGGLTLDWAGTWNGGLRNRDTLIALPDVNVAMDLDTLLGIPHTMFFLDAYQIEGRSIANDIGTIQGVSNIDSPNFAQVAECWVETQLFEQFRLKVGKVDVNSEFAFSEVMGEFVNPSGGITPTIFVAPTYPATAMSVNLFWNPSEFSYVGVGVYDGALAVGVNTGTQGPSGFFRNDESSEYFTVLEAGTSWTGGNQWGSGRAAVGAWYHGEQFERFDTTTERGLSGGYFVVDQIVQRENPEDAEDVQGIGVAFMLGFTEEDISQIGLHWQFGATWTGLIEGREDDVLGFLVTQAQLSSANGSTLVGDETIFEVLYRFQVTPAMSLKPDVQYVVNPGGDPTIDDALVGMLRVELTF